MNLWKTCFKLIGWSQEITVPYRKKAVICVAPHTSNWDFPIGLLAYRSLGRKANFLMKDFWFFFPLKYLLKSLGGIPVNRKSASSLTSVIAEDFKKSDYLNLAVTPEGTRKGVEHWKTGFLRIAYNAEVIVQLGVIDYKNKKVIIKEEYNPTGDFDYDLAKIRQYYSQFKNAARYPNNFIH